MAEKIQESRMEISRLFDLYGPLLTEKQQNLFRLYYDEDMSLSEIGEELRISRAAVHDALKVAEKSLKGYEEALGFQSKIKGIEESLDKITEGIKRKSITSNEIESGLKKIAESL